MSIEQNPDMQATQDLPHAEDPSFEVCEYSMARRASYTHRSFGISASLCLMLTVLGQ